MLAYIGTAMALGNFGVTRVVGSLTANFYVALWSIIPVLAVILILGELRLPGTPLGWAGALGNGLAWALSFVAFFAGARILGETRASAISMIDPLVAALLAYMLFGEWMTPLQWLGAGIMLAALALMERPTKRAT